MAPRIAVAALAAVATAGALSSCTVEQTDWRNHTYSLSADTCSTGAPLRVAVKNGVGYANAGSSQLVIRVERVVVGDMTGDATSEAAVLLSCTRPPTNMYGSELQVFTDGPQLLAKLSPPRTGNAVHSGWNASAISVSGDYLLTGAYEWSATDPRCCPSGSATFLWSWTGQAFTPVLTRTY